MIPDVRDVIRIPVLKRQMVTEFRSEKKLDFKKKSTEALVTPDSFIAFKIFAILISIDISIKIQAGPDQIWIHTMYLTCAFYI